MKLVEESKRFFALWDKAHSPTYSAAVAYYAVFSLAPLLLIAITIAGIFVDTHIVTEGMITQFRSVFGDGAAVFIRSLITADVSYKTSTIFIIFGVLVSLVGATGIFSGLQNGLDAILSDLPKKEKNGFLQIIAQKIYALGMVLSLGFVLLMSLIASAFLSIFSAQINTFLPGGAFVSSVIELVVSFALISLFLACILKVLPAEVVTWSAAIRGGFVAGAFFVLGKYILSYYLSHSSIANAYGAASSIVLLIIWAYYLSLALFVSAIITRLYFLKKDIR